jgi:hypothetical protein
MLSFVLESNTPLDAAAVRYAVQLLRFKHPSVAIQAIPPELVKTEEPMLLCQPLLNQEEADDWARRSVLEHEQDLLGHPSVEEALDAVLKTLVMLNRPDDSLLFQVHFLPFNVDQSGFIIEAPQ